MELVAGNRTFHPRHNSKTVRWIRTSIFTVLLFAFPLIAQAQLLPAATPAGNASSFDTQQSGLFTTASVELEGNTLFRVAVKGITNDAQLAAESRALAVTDQIDQLFAIDTATGKSLYDPSTLHVWTKHDGAQDVIMAADARHEVPITLVTVTTADAKSQQSTVEDVAGKWQQALQDTLPDALRNRQPAVQREHLFQALRLAVELTLGTVIVLLILRWLYGITKELYTQSATLGAGGDKVAELRLDRKIKFVSTCSELLLWLLGCSWFIAAVWCLALFSQTTALSRSLTHAGTSIGLIWVVVAIANRLAGLAIAAVASTWLSRHVHLDKEERTRAILRIHTSANAISGFKTFALISCAAFLTLGQMGLPVVSVVTIGGVAALAITFATQNYLRDFVGGVMVLSEDQYAVGDYIRVNGYAGIVEALTLRMVQIRDASGNVVTIPHSAVTSVSNQSRIWSRLDYLLSIAPSADPEVATAVIRSIVDELAVERRSESPDLHIEWIGIDAFTQSWTLIRASIRTAPLHQFDLRREINARARKRFAAAGIDYGPQIESQYIPLT